MRPILFITFLLIFSVAHGQSKKYNFTLSQDALNLLDNNECDSILQRLDGFLTYKNEPVGSNPYVDAAYAKKDLNPFELFQNVESDGTDLDFYKPTVLAVLPAIKHQQYVIKISYLGVTPQKEIKQRLIYTLVAKKIKNDYYFFNAIGYNTRHWDTKQVGSIQYIFPNKLDMAKARQMDGINKTFAKKFSVTVIPVIYYRCDDPEQLLKMMGCDYIGNMYLSMSGGFAQSWTNTLLAGNNSELYVHELAHFYIAKLFPKTTRIMNEGYATYMGGSGGLSLQETKHLAKTYLNEHPETDITNVFTGFNRLQNGIPFTYVARYGFKKITALFNTTSDDAYFKTLQEITGVTQQQFPGYVKGLIYNN